MTDPETLTIVVSCENPRCREYGKPYELKVDGTFVGAHCHPCGVVLARNGYPYSGHKIPAETMRRIRQLSLPPEWVDAGKRAEALQRLIDKELKS